MQTNLLKDYTPIDCYKCGVTFFVTAYFDSQRLKDKGSFWCPNGHSQAYIKSTAEKLQEELNQAYKDNGNIRYEKMKAEAKLRLAERKIKRLSKKK